MMRAVGVVAISYCLCATVAVAQVAVPPPPRPTDSGPSGSCIDIPNISPKVPPLPSGGPCIKALQITSTNGSFTLGYVDTTLGTGGPALPGKWVSVKYAIYLDDGTKIDASDDHPDKSPISFPYGQHRVIPGWDNGGFEGMMVGGKRRLFIPYQLAYGEAGRPPTIPAKSGLIADVELVGVGDAPPPAPVAPPLPRPIAGTPSFADTIQFITGKLNHVGKVNFVAYVHDNIAGNDWTNQNTVEINNATAAVDVCQIGYHQTSTLDDATTANANLEIPLREVQNILVMPNEQVVKDGTAKAGHPSWDVKIDPQVITLVIQRANDQKNYFYFYDQETADRVAKALIHAVELCGGGNKDPF